MKRIPKFFKEFIKTLTARQLNQLESFVDMAGTDQWDGEIKKLGFEVNYKTNRWRKKCDSSTP